MLLLAGEARLWIDGEEEIRLLPGDQQLVPAHAVHRVTWTAPDRQTVWLALHFGEQG